MDTRFFLLTCGTGDLDQSALTPGRGAGARVRIPIPAYLLQTDGRTILFDTGMPDFAYTGDPRALAHEGEPTRPGRFPTAARRQRLPASSRRSACAPPIYTWCATASA